MCLFYKTQFEGPQPNKHLVSIYYVLGTALDTGFQEGNQAKPMLFLHTHIPVNKGCVIMLCLGTVQEKFVFLNYVVWLVCLFHFLSRKQTKIRNMQLCEDYLTTLALWESLQHKCLEASSSVSF